MFIEQITVYVMWSVLRGSEATGHGDEGFKTILM